MINKIYRILEINAILIAVFSYIALKMGINLKIVVVGFRLIGINMILLGLTHLYHYVIDPIKNGKYNENYVFKNLNKRDNPIRFWSAIVGSSLYYSILIITIYVYFLKL